MKARFALLLTLLGVLMLDTEARKPKQTIEQIAQSYDYTKAEDRYRWYQDARQHIIQKGGLNCVAGTALTIHKDGTFTAPNTAIRMFPDGTISLNPTDSGCGASLRNKKFPLPSNYPGESVIFPIRTPKDGPMTRQELDSKVFGMPTETPPAENTSTQ